jgi:hypothetical protein
MAETKTDFSEHITPELITPAWRVITLAGLLVGADAGFMIAAKGKVYFLMQRNWDILFAADKQDVKAEWPWHYFGAGVCLMIDGKVYKIHFIRPNRAEPIKSGSLDVASLGDILKDILPPDIGAFAPPLAASYDLYRDGKEAHRNAKAWREYLET